MAFLAVLTVLLLFIAALGQSWWWRGTGPWYGDASFCWGMFCLAVYIKASFCWGMFCLAVYITWPTIKALL